jgi:TctA family transporter
VFVGVLVGVSVGVLVGVGVCVSVAVGLTGKHPPSVVQLEPGPTQ